MAFSAKDFLEGVRRTWWEMKREEERLKEMEAALYTAKSAAPGLGVHTYTHSDISDRLIKVEDVRDRVAMLKVQWLDGSFKAVDMLHSIHSPLVYVALERHYLLGETWEKVACELDIDVSYCYRLAKRGYKEIEANYTERDQ